MTDTAIAQAITRLNDYLQQLHQPGIPPICADKKTKPTIQKGPSHGYGWVDEHARIWIPTGTKAAVTQLSENPWAPARPLPHNSPHWDVYDPQTETIRNAYPEKEREL